MDIAQQAHILACYRQAGVSVGTNYKELQKLPSKRRAQAVKLPTKSLTRCLHCRLEHATFGKFSSEATDAAVKDLVEGRFRKHLGRARRSLTISPDLTPRRSRSR